MSGSVCIEHNGKTGELNEMKDQSNRGGRNELVAQLRQQFKKDKLKKVLIQHRVRLCTLSKKEYVSRLLLIRIVFRKKSLR